VLGDTVTWEIEPVGRVIGMEKDREQALFALVLPIYTCKGLVPAAKGNITPAILTVPLDTDAVPSGIVPVLTKTPGNARFPEKNHTSE
jgi:hypothetical protein